MDQEDPAGGEDGSQRDARSQGHRLSDSLCGSSHAIGQIPAERRYSDYKFLFVTVRIRKLTLCPLSDLCNIDCLCPAGRHVSTVKPSSPPHYSLCVAGKEYVGIVRLHNAIESEHTLARVRLRTSCTTNFYLVRMFLNTIALNFS